jgi:hypothetical protein
VFLIIILVVIALIFFSRYLKRFDEPKTEQDLYGALLQRCFGDRELVERLIELEKKGTPTASRATLIRMAIERLDRHNR